jgi:uncharacterized iron-regulated membrane protein
MCVEIRHNASYIGMKQWKSNIDIQRLADTHQSNPPDKLVNQYSYKETPRSSCQIIPQTPAVATEVMHRAVKDQKDNQNRSEHVLLINVLS